MRSDGDGCARVHARMITTGDTSPLPRPHLGKASICFEHPGLRAMYQFRLLSARKPHGRRRQGSVPQRQARREGIVLPCNPMEWRDLEVWRRQRPFIGAELRKDAPDHLARLGLATSFVFVVGMAEGARVSAVKGDLKFPIRYAMYNAIPSFVGGKVPASSVASAMANAPPLRACPKAAAHAANLRALRTAVAGYTVLSVVFQVALAGGRGTEAHQRAVAEGLEMPSLSASSSGAGGGSAGGVVRLCGARGLEPALVAAAAARGGYRSPVLPVVISGGVYTQKHSTRSSGSPGDLASFSLPEGARVAVAEASPRSCYYRIHRDSLFCRQAWQPVAAEVAAARANSSDSRETIFVLEADALSSDDPRALMSPPLKSVATRIGSGGGGSVGGRLGEDQAVWGLAMLRRALEEKRGRESSGRVASVLLAERRMAAVEGSTTVSIDARAALLLSVLSCVQQWAVEAGTDDASSSSSRSIGEPSASPSLPADDVEETREHEIAATELSGSDAVAESMTTATGVQAKDAFAVHDAADEVAATPDEESSGTADEEEKTIEPRDLNTPPDGEDQAVRSNTTARVLGTLEGVGRGVRMAVVPVGHVWSAVGRSVGIAFAWAKEKRRKIRPLEVAGMRRTLLYDTDDDDSFRWLAAQMLRTGWTVVRTTSQLEDVSHVVPVLVHRSSDERTLTAASRHVARGAHGSPVCAVIHNWDCAAEARRLLRETPGPTLGDEVGIQGPQSPSAEVICTAEVGEDLFQFVRWQLLSGATTEQVQKGLDDLFGAFYEFEGEDMRSDGL